MNTFAHQIDAQWEREGPLGVDFVRGLLGQVWDADRGAIDSHASRQLVEALNAELWLLDPDLSRRVGRVFLQRRLRDLWRL